LHDVRDRECFEKMDVEVIGRPVHGLLELKLASVQPVEVELNRICIEIMVQRYRLLTVDLPNLPAHWARLSASTFGEPLRHALLVNVLAALSFAEGEVARFGV
jgi:hypothetical protein